MGRSVLAFALALLLLIAAVAACQSTTPTSSPTPSPAPTSAPTQAETPAPTSTASIPVGPPSPTPTRNPKATSTPASTPLPTGAPGAFFAVRKYEDAIIAGDYKTAWAMLGKGSTSHWGNSAAFKNERAAFIATAGNTPYQEELSPTNTLTLRQWVEGQPWAPSIDQAHAYLVSIKWPAVADPGGWEIWVVNPTPSGWALYLAHF